jgi:hypothetical protein
MSIVQLGSLKKKRRLVNAKQIYDIVKTRYGVPILLCLVSTFQHNELGPPKKNRGKPCNPKVTSRNRVPTQFFLHRQVCICDMRNTIMRFLHLMTHVQAFYIENNMMASLYLLSTHLI